jgi:hypothetical protein
MGSGQGAPAGASAGTLAPGLQGDLEGGVCSKSLDRIRAAGLRYWQPTG